VPCDMLMNMGFLFLGIFDGLHGLNKSYLKIARQFHSAVQPLLLSFA